MLRETLGVGVLVATGAGCGLGSRWQPIALKPSAQTPATAANISQRRVIQWTLKSIDMTGLGTVPRQDDLRISGIQAGPC